MVDHYSDMCSIFSFFRCSICQAIEQSSDVPNCHFLSQFLSSLRAPLVSLKGVPEMFLAVLGCSQDWLFSEHLTCILITVGPIQGLCSFTNTIVSYSPNCFVVLLLSVLSKIFKRPGEAGAVL